MLTLVMLPSLALAAQDEDTKQLYLLLSSAYSHFLLPIGSVLAGIMIIFGGIVYSTSGGDATKVAKGKEFIFGAITGLALLIFAAMIVQNIST